MSLFRFAIRLSLGRPLLDFRVLFRAEGAQKYRIAITRLGSSPLELELGSATDSNLDFLDFETIPSIAERQTVVGNNRNVPRGRSLFTPGPGRTVWFKWRPESTGNYYVRSRLPELSRRDSRE